MTADSFCGRNVLITGGLGFIGSNLAIQLAEYGATVTILDSLAPQFGGSLVNIEPIRNEVDVRIGDMRDTDTIESLVREKDFIFNLAGQVGHKESMQDPILDLNVNCLSALCLLEACRKFNPTARLLFTSTRQVYGKAKSLPVNEDHPTIPVDINGIHKLAAEHYYQLYHRIYGIRSTILRLTNTFGPRQKICCSSAGFAGFFIYQALRGETIRIFGDGGQRRDFNYVDDVAKAILLAVTSDDCQGQYFNLGSAPAYSMLGFVEAMREFCDVRIQKIPFPPESKAIEIGDYCADFSRFGNSCGWKPCVDLHQGLGRTFEFYRQHAMTYGV